MSQHVHKYRRFATTNEKSFWRCMIPSCTHALYQKELLIGRSSLCWFCNEPFVLRESNIEQAKPVCESCKQYRKEQREKLRRIS